MYLTGPQASVLMVYEYILVGVGENTHAFTKYKERNALFIEK